MSEKLSEQPSLLDVNTLDAANLYELSETEPQLKRRSDYLANRLFSKQDLMRNFDQASCIASRMTQLLEVLPGGVVVLDGDGIVQQCNSAAINLLGEIIEGESWLAISQRAFTSAKSNDHDVTLKDGRLIHISTSRLEAEPGQIILLQDVTETRQLQQKVAHLQRLSAMGEMAARLAHQIRTPLSSALLYLAPLLKQEGDAKLKQRFAKRLHNSISHMERLVKDMLAFSRGDMAETSPVSLEQLLNSVEVQFQSQPDADLFQLVVENTVSEGFLYGSNDALTSAINNLVNNARLACEQSGEITIFADLVQGEDGDDFIEISVEDNGIGIPLEEQDKILAPFYTTRSAGTGLGLAVVKSIAKAHKGELWFESVPGEGSTFCLRLPRYQTAEKFTLTAQR